VCFVHSLHSASFLYDGQVQDETECEFTLFKRRLTNEVLKASRAVEYGQGPHKEPVRMI